MNFNIFQKIYLFVKFNTTEFYKILFLRSYI